MMTLEAAQDTTQGSLLLAARGSGHCMLQGHRPGSHSPGKDIQERQWRTCRTGQEMPHQDAKVEEISLPCLALLSANA